MAQTLEEEIRILRTHYWSARDPDGRAFAPLADAYRRKGELDEAGSLVRDGLGRLPEFATGHLVAARVSRDQGDLVEARGHLDRVLDLDPENVQALLERSELAGIEGDREQSLGDLHDLLDLEPGHAEARSALEELEDSAVWEPAEIESAWDADPFEIEPPPDAPDNPEESDIDRSEAVEAGDAEDEERSIYTRTMGEIYVRQGFLHEAVEIFERLSRRAPGDAELRARLEEIRDRLGEAGSGARVDRPPASGEAEPVGDLRPAVPDPAASARSIGDYFQDLLAWVPGAVPIESLAPAAVPIESLAPEAVEVERLAPDGDEESPDVAAEPSDAAAGEKGEDDDDLDEFQSWLESLQT